MIGHFLPAYTIKALPLCNSPGAGQGFKIPVQAFLHEFASSPKSKMRGMPPMHFKMRFAEPAVIGKTGFLWRKTRSTLQTRQVLRGYDTPLKFMRPVIGAACQINRPAAFPECQPACYAVTSGLCKTRQWLF